MEPFSSFHLPLDSSIPTTNTIMCPLPQEPNTINYPPTWFISDEFLQWPADQQPTLDQNDVLMTHHVPADYNKNNASSINSYNSSSSAASILTHHLLAPKRKPPSPTFPQHSKGMREVIKGKRQKKMRGCEEIGNKKSKEEKRKLGADGCIHVRAKRGEATDSHSLAERIRRERISERMKLLQALVPGCDKVTGKALMLDEIINYVKSLQNQVEFLSMKLASVNPILSGSGTDLEPFPEFDQNLNILQSALQSSPTAGTSSYPHLLNNYDDGLISFQQPHNISNADLPQGFWELVDEQRQEIINIQTGSSGSLFSFH